MKKLNILMAIDKLSFRNPGGAGRVFYEWAEGLASRGHHIYLIFRRTDKEFVWPGSTENIHIFSYENNFRNPLFFFASALLNNRALFNRVMRENNIDIANFHHPVSAIGAGLSGFFKRVRKIYTLHALWGEEYAVRRKKKGIGFLLRRYMEREAVSGCSGALVLSNYSRQKLLSVKDFPGSEVGVVPGGIDLQRFSPPESRQAVREGLNIPADKRVLLTVRRLEPRMGIDNLIMAMASVTQKLKNAMLIIVGKGPSESELKTLVSELDLEECVMFSGFVDDEKLPLYYQAADVFVLPSIDLEGFGLVTLEALACGTPVLGTPVGGTPEILPGLDKKLVFGGTGPADIAEGITGYFSDVQKAAEISGRARGFAEENYSWDAAITRIENFLVKMKEKTDKIKVLHLITRLDRGGSSEVVLSVVSVLSGPDFDFTIGYGPSREKDCRLTELAKEKGVRLVYMPFLVRGLSPIKDFMAMPGIFSLIKRGKFDIIHTNTSKAGILGRFAARLARGRGRRPGVIHTPHGHVFYGYYNRFISGLFLAAEKWAAGFTDKIVALTDNEIDEYVKFGISSDRSKFAVIHSGVDTEKDETLKMDVSGKKAQLGLPEGARIIGSAGRLEKIKGYGYFIEAASEILRSFPECVFLLAGDGSLRAGLQGRLKKLGIEDKFRLLGWRNDTEEIISLFDIFVLSSLNEGLGMVLVEAMALGKPVVATRVGGVPSVVEEGQTGLLVAPCDPKAMAGAVCSLLEDPERCRKMGEKARQRARMFSSEKMIEKTRFLYKSYMNK